MIDNEIIKALECCNGGDCEECEAIDECCCFPEKLIVEASGLIKRQKAKIERLEKEKVLNSVIFFSSVKAEAIKEFAERLKYYTNNIPFYRKDVERMIDNLVKEMTEQRKEDNNVMNASQGENNVV